MSPGSESDFKVVINKKKSKRKPVTKLILEDHYSNNVNSISEESVKIRVQQAKEEILSSNFYESVSASLREALLALGQPAVNSIICLGLGRIGECLIPRYQFALLLCLKDLYQTDVKLYDPVFTDTDKKILEHFSCSILNENGEGKIRVDDNCTTLFYFPHCPKQLTNNLLWSNWGLNLNNCIVLANSFTSIVESSPRRVLEDEAQYILKIFPHVLELAIINNFRFFEIFSDTAIHIFPMDKLSLVSDEFWENPIEPQYSEDNLEFITNKLQIVQL